MTGHSPAPTVTAVRERAARGITLMLPTEDSSWVAAELGRRFGLPRWQFALTATDANRFALRLARAITGRPKVLVYAWCYHGTVDESFAIEVEGETRSRPDNIGPPVDPAVTTRAVEWNDVDALERALEPGDVACVLAEPAMTNAGIVLPDPGYHEALRELTRQHGTLLIIDETHTFCAGPGGYTAAEGLDPDLLTIGKAIAGGIPAAAYGMTEEVSERIAAYLDEPRDLRRGRHRRDAGGQRALARGGPGDPRGGPHRRGLRPHDPDGGALRGRRERGDRRSRRAVELRAPRMPGGVPLPGVAAAQRLRGARRGRQDARPLHAPPRAQPGDPADAVPQHGADVPRDDRGGRRPPHRGVRRGGGGAHGHAPPPDRPPSGGGQLASRWRLRSARSCARPARSAVPS